MRSSLALLVVLALVLVLGACTMIDVRWAPSGGVHSHAFISGYADAGWAASDSLLKVGIFDGPSRGALLYLQIWKLFRFELGFIGAAIGLGPLDCGVGVLLYDPHPPEYTKDTDGQNDESDDSDEGDHSGEHGDDEPDEQGSDLVEPVDAATVHAGAATPQPVGNPHSHTLY